jgi:hypothetical protein
MLVTMNPRAHMYDAEAPGIVGCLVLAVRRLADTATNAMRDGGEAIALLWRREVNRAIATYNLWLALVLFAWSAAMLAAAALIVGLWDTHRVAAILYACGGLFVMAMAAAVALQRRRSGRQ